jgi:hypothetical protein
MKNLFFLLSFFSLNAFCGNRNEDLRGSDPCIAAVFYALALFGVASNGEPDFSDGSTILSKKIRENWTECKNKEGWRRLGSYALVGGMALGSTIGYRLFPQINFPGATVAFGAGVFLVLQFFVQELKIYNHSKTIFL